MNFRKLAESVMKEGGSVVPRNDFKKAWKVNRLNQRLDAEAHAFTAHPDDLSVQDKNRAFERFAEAFDNLLTNGSNENWYEKLGRTNPKLRAALDKAIDEQWRMENLHDNARYYAYGLDKPSESAFN